ncbi:cysteine desulfurase [Candidatus Saccharibacteria bacterium]|nr:cysteine desulfurase [Candidatus Saccharibacteria bacterium]
MIYLDHAAATPVNEKVLKAMEPYFAVDFFNPSAAYLPAKKVASDYEAAKAVIAHAIGAKASDLVITAGATEANNLAFTCLSTEAQGLAEPIFSDARLEFSSTSYTGQPAEPSLRDEPVENKSSAGRRLDTESKLSVSSSPTAVGSVRNIRVENSNHVMHPKKQVSATRASVLYLETEHDSIRRVAERYGGQSVRVLSNGLIDLKDLRSKISDETELISVALVNNELGTIQPMAEIASIIREIKIDRMKRGIKKQLLLHSDASQALNLLDINVARLGVDLLTLNSAKIYGPKGVGALYVSHDARLKPLTMGGGQENGLRSGTENVSGVIGFAKAVELAKEHLNGNRKKYASWRKILLEELQGYELINKKHSLDNFAVICYNNIDAERLVFLLEEKEVYVATGAACAASKGVRSHVLKAIGLSDSQIAGSLRITLGETNDEAQIHEAAKIINDVVQAEKQRTATT